MNIEHEQRGKYLLIRVKGRLDAAWAEYFTEELFLQIRQGQHHVVIDAADMVFLSSAGIRALLQVFKELNAVQGSFLIVNATPFVVETLTTTRFQMWLGEKFPADMPTDGSAEGAENVGIESYPPEQIIPLTFSKEASWHPWQVVEPDKVTTAQFPPDMIALGIGSSADDFADARRQLGEFLAVAGNVVYQLPDEEGHPDYLISEKEYVPRMQCIQLLSCTGELGYHIRFAPTEETPFYPLSSLLQQMLKETKGHAVGFVILGEIEGLVGSFLIRSPGLLKESRTVGFPEIRDWLSFCGERSHAHQQALITGVAGPANEFAGIDTVPELPSTKQLAAHVHAAVFPYQPLQNGKIELQTAIRKFFNGPPPLAVLHLAHDVRPVVGLGESALLRGACWFGPLQTPEVLS